MQKIIVTIISYCCMNCCFSQEGKNTPAPLTKQEYLKKSGNQKRMAGILFGIGTSAFIIASSSSLPSEYAIPFVLGGGVAVISSIPFFIASGKNKKRALNASAGIELQQIPNPSIIVSKPLTAISIKFHF